MSPDTYRISLDLDMDQAVQLVGEAKALFGQLSNIPKEVVDDLVGLLRPGVELPGRRPHLRERQSERERGCRPWRRRCAGGTNWVNGFSGA